MSAEETAKFYPLALAAAGLIVIAAFSLWERRKRKGLKPPVQSRLGERR